MSIGWIVFGTVMVIGLVAVFAFALARAASNGERALRRARWDRLEFPDLAMTTSGPDTK